MLMKAPPQPRSRKRREPNAFAREINVRTNKLDAFVSGWCLDMTKWIDKNRAAIDAEHRANRDVGMTGKDALTRAIFDNAHELQRLAQKLALK